MFEKQLNLPDYNDLKLNLSQKDSQFINYYRNIGFKVGESLIIRASSDKHQLVYLGIVRESGIELWATQHQRNNADKTAKYKPTYQIKEPITHLRTLGLKGYGVFSYPNHVSGGMGNQNATAFTALFYEDDHRSLEEQKQRWGILRNLGIEPAIAIYSGGKSYHTYIGLTENIGPERWKQLNRMLSIVMDSDPTISTLARAMRLPGVPRVKNGEVREVEIVHHSDHRYTPEQIENALLATELFKNGLSEARWQKYQFTLKKESREKALKWLSIPENELTCKSTYQTYDNYPHTNGEYIPLNIVISKQNRLYLKGVDSYRNSTGISLAKDLLGSYERLTSKGFRTDDPYSVFLEYCQNCQQGDGWNPREWENIWKSATRGNPRPAIPDNAFWGCVNAYLYRENNNFPATFSKKTIEKATDKFKNLVAKAIKTIKPKGFGVPKIEGQEFEGDRAETWMSIEGDILECSSTGEGKSHAVNKVADAFLAEHPGGKVFYVYHDHRNPTVKAIEDEFTDLFPRNQHGFYRENGKLKRANEHTPQNQIEVTSGHCTRAGLFNRLNELGHNPHEGGSSNPICSSCQFLATCQSREGWYLRDRRDTFTNAQKIRCHIDSVRGLEDYRRYLFIYDEAKQLFKPTKDIETNWDKLYLELARVRSEKALTDKQFLSIESFLQSLKSNFENKQRYGLAPDVMAKELEAIEKPSNLDAIIEAIEANPLDLTSLFPVSDDIDPSQLSQAERKKYQSAIRMAKSYFCGKAYGESQSNLEKVPPNALNYVLKALRGDKGIALSVAYGVMIITFDNRDSYSFINQTKKNIYLDATISVEELKMRTGSDRPITAIRSKVKPTHNLTVVQIKTQGIGSNQISKKAINRLRKICQALGDMPTIASKLIREYLDVDGHWFNHNRASNDFVGKQKLLVIGLPRPNLGAIKSEYLVLQGTLDGFEEYYQKLINQEIIQAVGRQRANRYPDKQFTLYFVTPEDIDLSWLAEYGIKIIVKSAFEIDPDAGTETQCTRLQIVNTVQSLLANGAKVTQTAIAKLLGMTQQAISKTLTDSGVDVAWIVGKLSKILPNGYTIEAYKGSIRPSCITQQLYKLFADFFQLAPLELLRDALDTIQERGLEYFATEYLENFPKALQAKYLTLLWTVLQSESMPTENRSSDNVKSHSSLREIFLL